MRPGVMVSGRWVRMVLWCLVCVSSAGYPRCDCWCWCVDGGGLSACLPVELVPALSGRLCARVAAVVCGGCGGGRCAGGLEGVVGCGCTCGCVLGVGCGGSAGGGGVVAVRVADCVVWWCVASAWMVPMLVFWVGCLMWVRRLRGVVGCDGGFSDVCGRRVAAVVGSVCAGWWWWLWLDCLVVVVSVGGPNDGPRVCGGGWACTVVVVGWCVIPGVAGCGTFGRVVCDN